MGADVIGRRTRIDSTRRVTSWRDPALSSRVMRLVVGDAGSRRSRLHRGKRLMQRLGSWGRQAGLWTEVPDATSGFEP